jgi:hypothetical protein
MFLSRRVVFLLLAMLLTIGVVCFVYTRPSLKPAKIYKVVRPDTRRSPPKEDIVPIPRNKTDGTLIDDTQEHPDTAVLSEVLSAKDATESELGFLGEFLTLVEDEVVDDEDVAVSPFGFGPYPETPADYPYTVTWEYPDHFSLELQKDLELIKRVLIKLWQQGEKDFIGGFLDPRTGRVYPNYNNSLYVRRKVQKDPDGTVRLRISEIGGSPRVMMWEEDLQKLHETGEAPPGIQILDLNEEGFDPYQFLGLIQ